MQAVNCWGRKGSNPPGNFFAPLGKMFWTWFKTIGHILKISAPLRELFAPPFFSLCYSDWMIDFFI